MLHFKFPSSDIASIGMLIFLFIHSVHAQTPSAADSAITYRLYELVIRRLELMPDVAAAKKTARLPVTDTLREKQVLSQFRADAMAKGLEPRAAEDLMQWQILLASKIQRQYIAAWERGTMPFPGPGKGLAPLRVELDAIGKQLMDHLVLCAPHFALGRFHSPPASLLPRIQSILADSADRNELYRRMAAQRFIGTGAIENRN